MRRYLLDSNALNDVINGIDPVAAVRAAKLRGDQIGTCEPVVAEFYAGLEYSGSRDRNMPRFERGIQRLKSWPLDRLASREYGRIAAELKRRGGRMQVVDVMIAAIALTLGNCTVVTTDSDFARIPGLDVIDWTLPPPPEPTQP